MKRFTLTLVIFAFILALGAGQAVAKGPDPETDRFNISLGTYLISFDTNAQVSSTNGLGTVIDMEEVLGLDDRRTDFRLDGYWRFSRKHRLDFGLFYDSRSGTRTLSEQIIWDDATYDLGAEIDSKFSTSYLKLAYRYAFVRDDRAEVGLSAGLATIRLAAEISGEGTVDQNGVPSALQFVKKKESVLAPVPVVGLYGSFVIVEGLFFRPAVEFFSLNTGGISGALVDSRATVDWFFSERWGVGLGFSRVRVEYQDEESDPRVDVNTKFGGALLYFSYSF